MGEDPKQIALRLVEALAAGEAADIEALLSPHYAHHGSLPAMAGRVFPARELRRYFAGIHAVFPDFAVHVEDALAEGDKVAVRWTAHGTQRGEFLGVAPTGKRLTWTGVTIVRVDGGHVAEGWWTVDALDARHALGLAARPDRAPGGHTGP